MKWNWVSIFTMIAFFSGCARVQTLNMEKHKYSERPENVVWIQVPGLSVEQLALLRLNTKNAIEKTSLESAQCIGSAWNYNLFEMQPESRKGLISQVNGSQNIKGTCDDFIQKPVWRYFKEMGYNTAVFEQVNTLEESVLRAKSCGSSETYINSEDTFLVMSPQKFLNEGEFHRLEKTWGKKGIAFDQACLSGACVSTLEANVQDFYQDWAKLNAKNFLLVRTQNLERALKSKDLSKVKESLSEVHRLVNFFRSKITSRSLLVVSSSAAIGVEYPLQAKEWGEFERSGKFFNFKATQLTSPVFAFGAMAENFCGMYSESDVLKRILYIPPGKKFDWDYVIPF